MEDTSVGKDLNKLELVMMVVLCNVQMSQNVWESLNMLNRVTRHRTQQCSSQVNAHGN